MTTPTARERAEAMMQWIIQVGPPIPSVEWFARQIEAAAHAAREEERATMSCGHPRACWTPSVPQAHPHSGCNACTREQRAVEEAVAKWRNLAGIQADALEIANRGNTRVEKLIADAEFRVRRECAEQIRKAARGTAYADPATHALADAIERGERGGDAK